MPRLRLAALLAASLGAGSCSSPSPPRETPSAPILLAGAEHLEPFLRGAVRAFRDRYPDSDPIQVVANGSAEAMEQLVNGEVGMAILYRELSEPEARAAIARQGLQAHAIAWDAVAVIVHPSCGVEQISRTELGQVYRGELTRWKDLGWGSGGRILALTTDPKRGLYGYIEQTLLGGGAYGPEIVAPPREEDVVGLVAERPNAIGCVSWALVDARVRALPVAPAVGLPYVALTQENLVLQKYPLLRSVSLCTQATPRQTAADFVTFVSSNEGQRVVARHGLAPATVPVRIVRTEVEEP